MTKLNENQKALMLLALAKGKTPCTRIGLLTLRSLQRRGLVVATGARESLRPVQFAELTSAGVEIAKELQLENGTE